MEFLHIMISKLLQWLEHIYDINLHFRLLVVPTIRALQMFVIWVKFCVNVIFA